MNYRLVFPPRACNASSLYKALSSEEPVERRKASACLSRIGRAVTAVQANEKERDADSNVIKAAVKPLLRFQPEAGGGVEDDQEGMCNANTFCVATRLGKTKSKADDFVHNGHGTYPGRLKLSTLPLRLVKTAILRCFR